MSVCVRQMHQPPFPENTFLAVLPQTRARLSACRACKRTKQRCDDTRPCGRCIRNDRAESCVTDDTESVQKPGPIYSRKTSDLNDACKPWQPSCFKPEWCRASLMEFWVFGYYLEAVARFFDSIPKRLSEKIKELLDLFERRHRIKNFRMKRRRTDQLAILMGSEHQETMKNIEEVMWGQEQQFGFHQVEVDAEKMQQKSISVNARFAEILGTDQDAFLTRYTKYEGILHSPAWDTLAWLIFGLKCFAAELLGKINCGERYFRAFSYREHPRRAVLLWCLKGSIYDDNLKLTQETCIIRTITAEEYDEAVRLKPELCPLYLSGDTRTGQQLLDDINKDSDVTLASLSETPVGAERLRRLEATVQELCACFDSENGH